MSTTWSKATLRIHSRTATPQAIANDLGRASSAPASSPFWLLDLEESAEDSLDETLQAVQRFLEEKLESLRGISEEAEIGVMLAWTPRSGQDGIQFNERLIFLLSQLGAYVTLDTYLG
ncbi:hypothetical protein ABZU32_40530 [Sphaerisporangium sp. NPDC005288]|uniref:hypothetical protein n=1 Tax=Sphaerisporangium sp. NPDC005288 TaxID=3155114 RepID=UPI0033B0D76E